MTEKMEVEKASDIVEACSDRREEAIDYVIHACVHNVSAAITELDETNAAWQNAIEVWYELDHADKKKSKLHSVK